MYQPIALESVRKMRDDFIADGENLVRMNSVAKAGIDAAGLRYEAAVETPNVFSRELKTGEITSQNSSGRCWLFAAANILRRDVMRVCDLENFELSQAYLFFWDKFERANYFLESILDTLDEDQDSRLLRWLLQGPFADGGQWDMAVALVEKYGVVPKAVMPESFNSSNSGKMNKYLTLKAREFAKTLRDAHRAGAGREELQRKKEAMLGTFFRILCICLGAPPERFDFEVRGRDKDAKDAKGDAGGAAPADEGPKPFKGGVFTRNLGMSPLEFYKTYVNKPLSDYISLINAPTADKAYYQTYTVAYLGNVAGGKPVLYLNLPVESLKRAAVAQLESGESVWFGCDVGQMMDSDQGILSMGTYDVENLLRTDFPLDKAARLDYSESSMCHAMVLQGVNLVDGRPNRWKVENSWGDKRCDKGWFRMSDEWFDEYVYQVVVDKKYLVPEETAALEKKPLVLKPWDPMGAVAF
ncbi:MAG: C1 family peptidase [Treponema sp.]|jgi:bleomycin hydrolase|nr:C1 family peptidase [Treponema sp.]